MKRIKLAFLVLSISMLFSLPLQAQDNGGTGFSLFSGGKWFLSAEIPVSYTFNTSADGSALEADGAPVGVLLFAHTPIMAGVGLEYYSISLKDTSSTGDIKNSVTITMLDAFYSLPIPVVIIGIGGGIGYAEVTGDNAGYFEQTTAYQYFLRAGVAIPSIWQFYLSIHKVTAQVKFKDTETFLKKS